MSWTIAKEEREKSGACLSARVALMSFHSRSFASPRVDTFLPVLPGAGGGDSH